MDLGFQFGLLQRSANKSKGDKNKLSTYCYCPCSNFMSAWQKHFDLQDILNRTEVHDCGRKGVFNTHVAFYDHCSSIGESGLVHSSMASYLKWRTIHKYK